MPLPPGKQVSVFRLLLEADAPGVPGCRRGSAALGAGPGRVASFSQCQPKHLRCLFLSVAP